MSSEAEEFRCVFEAHYGDVLGYALRRTTSRQDAEDVAAETFQVAWRRLDDLPARNETRLWLFGTARRVLANHHRGRRRARSLFERVRAANSPWLLHHDPTREVGDADQLARALHSLKESDREVLRLHAWEDLSAAEIAAVLDVSTAAVWKRLERARGRLAHALDKVDTDETAARGRLGDVPTI